MQNGLDCKSLWGQLVCSDLRFLTGPSVAEFVQLIIDAASITAVIVADIEGAMAEGLTQLEGGIIRTDDFLKVVRDAAHVDWAFFFLFREKPAVEAVPVESHSDHRSMMRRADITIRLADDQYFYVYSTDLAFIGQLRAICPAPEYKVSNFEELDVLY